jgi:hypothetical protein
MLAASAARGGGGAGRSCPTSPEYSLTSLNGSQSAETELAFLRAYRDFADGVNYATAGHYDLARAKLGPHAVPTKESNLMLRLLSGLTTKNRIELKACTADRKFFQESTLTWGRLQVTKL